MLVRPKIKKNGSIAWSPHTQNNIDTLKKIHRSAARFVVLVHDHRRTTSVTHMQGKLGWQTLDTRRLQHQLVFLYKIKYNLLNIFLPQHLVVPCTQIYQRLIDISLHHNIEQVIDKPTRGDNILDLFLTNNKSALQNFETLPPIGKADHDIVYIEINARPNRQNTPHRNVFIFRNANWDGIK